MATQASSLALLLDGLETQLKVVGRWQLLPPSDAALVSTVPFCTDTLSFTQWLQWVMIPRFRALILSEAPLPVAGGILPMAEYALSEGEGVEPILRLIQRIDILLS